MVLNKFIKLEKSNLIHRIQFKFISKYNLKLKKTKHQLLINLKGLKVVTFKLITLVVNRYLKLYKLIKAVSQSVFSQLSQFIEFKTYKLKFRVNHYFFHSQLVHKGSRNISYADILHLLAKINII
jgi:hypothetical protein